MFDDYLREAEANGLLSEYAPNHFLIQAMAGRAPTFFAGHQDIQNNSMLNRTGMDIASTFVSNFSCALQQLSNHFSAKDIENFITGQLAAGKTNYKESQFIQAFSEVTVLKYLTCFANNRVASAIYEPRIRGQTNPEARIDYEDGVTLDIEIKTPCFPGHINVPENKKGIIKANFILTDSQFQTARNICQEENIGFMPPRVLKIKDYIESASRKFATPDNINHFNILFINWTLSDFYGVGINEPVGIIGNPANGLMHSQQAAHQIKLSQEDMEKISAIVIYRDSFDSIISCDYRWHFAGPKRIELIIHDQVAKEHIEKIARKLNRNPMNTVGCEWSPIDWAFAEDRPKDGILTQAAAKRIYQAIQQQ